VDDLRDLLPQDKCDTERAEALVALGFPAVAPVLSELVEWLQDYNWPVAHVLAPFLASLGAPLVPQVRDVLDTDDHVWKYWVLGCIVAESPAVFEAVQLQVRQAALAPDGDEDDEAVREQARQVLRHYGQAVYNL
jgi:hypothetical protein